MSIYSGFATRHQQEAYDQCLNSLLYVLQKRILKFYQKEQTDEYKFTALIQKMFLQMKNMEKSKYLEPKSTYAFQELVNYLTKNNESQNNATNENNSTHEYDSVLEQDSLPLKISNNAKGNGNRRLNGVQKQSHYQIPIKIKSNSKLQAQKPLGNGYQDKSKQNSIESRRKPLFRERRYIKDSNTKGVNSSFVTPLSSSRKSKEKRHESAPKFELSSNKLTSNNAVAMKILESNQGSIPLSQTKRISAERPLTGISRKSHSYHQHPVRTPLTSQDLMARRTIKDASHSQKKLNAQSRAILIQAEDEKIKLLDQNRENKFEGGGWKRNAYYSSSASHQKPPRPFTRER